MHHLIPLELRRNLEGGSGQEEEVGGSSGQSGSGVEGHRPLLGGWERQYRIESRWLWEVSTMRSR